MRAVQKLSPSASRQPAQRRTWTRRSSHTPLLRTATTAVPSAAAVAGEALAVGEEGLQRSGQLGMTRQQRLLIGSLAGIDRLQIGGVDFMQLPVN